MDWLLLRGLLREQRHWGDFTKNFESSIHSAKVHCLDLPGIGTESFKQSPNKIREIMEDIRSRWHSIGNNKPINIFSVSLGGMIAMEWLRYHPDEISKLVVVCSSARNLSNPLERFKIKNLLHFPKYFTTNDTLKREKTILTMTLNRFNEEQINAIAEKNKQFALPVKKFRQTGTRQMFAGSKFKIADSLKAHASKFLILGSEGDKLVAPQCSQKIGAFLNVKVVMHPWAGHDLPLNDPNWVLNEIKIWLNQQPK